MLWIGFGTAFPVLFFPYSRGLWLGVDYLFDPGEAAESEQKKLGIEFISIQSSAAQGKTNPA